MNLTAEQMIDPTSAHRIFSELDYIGSPISFVIDVLDEPLAKIGELLLQNTAESDIALSELIKADKIRLNWNSGDAAMPMTNCVDCIRIEPFYIIKDRKIKYE